MTNIAMTKRDKKLLILLACIILLSVFGWMIIRPLLTAGAELDAQLNAAASEKAAMEDKIKRYDQIAADSERLADTAATAAQSYYPLLKSREIDREITNLILSQGLKVEELNIVMPKETYWATPYYLSDDAADNSDGEVDVMLGSTLDDVMAEAEYDIPPKAETAEETIGRTVSIYAAQLRVQVRGNRDQLWNLLEALQANPHKMRITGMISGKQENAADEQETMTIELEIYMCDGQSAEE